MSAERKSLRLFLAAVAALFMTAATGVQAGPKDELKDIRDRIEALQKRLTESEGSKAEVADSLRDSERAVSETSRKLYQLSGQRRQVNSALSRLQSRTGVVENDIADEQATLSRLLYQQYVGGQSDVIKLVLNGEDPNEIARQLHYLSYVSQARAELLANLRENLATLEKLTGESRRKSSELHALQSEETLQMRRLEKEKAERQRVYASVSDDIDKSRKQLIHTQTRRRTALPADRAARQGSGAQKQANPANASPIRHCRTPTPGRDRSAS